MFLEIKLHLIAPLRWTPPANCDYIRFHGLGGARRSVQSTGSASTNRIATAVRADLLPFAEPEADVSANTHRFRPRTDNTCHISSPWVPQVKAWGLRSAPCAPGGSRAVHGGRSRKRKRRAPTTIVWRFDFLVKVQPWIFVQIKFYNW